MNLVLFVSVSAVTDPQYDYRIIDNRINHTIVPRSILPEASEFSSEDRVSICFFRQVLCDLFQDIIDLVSADFLEISKN